MKKAFFRNLTLKFLTAPFFVLAAFFIVTALLSAQMNDQVPYFALSDSPEPRGGVITLSSEAEPVIEVGSLKAVGELQIKLYKADKNFLLNYLRHDSEGKQLNRNPDTSGMEQIAEFTETVSPSYSDGNRISLPLSESGIWFITSTSGEYQNHAVVVRSPFGGLVKNMGDQFVVWTQDFASLRSLSGISVTNYDMTNEGRQIGSGTTNGDGVVQLPFSTLADIALLERGDQLAVLPINMEYFNTGYSYTRFSQIGDEFKYYLFTDRPLYKPGDTVYFKALIRQDDDARYSIPTGTARITMIRGWSDQDVVFEKLLPISADGSVHGEYALPADVTTGDYSLIVQTVDDEVAPGWREDGRAYIQVEEYRKPEYYLELSSKKDTYYMGEAASVNVQGMYFSGQPLGGGQVKYRVSSWSPWQPTSVESLKYFVDDEYRYGYYYGEDIAMGTVGLDGAGRAEIALPTQDYEGSGKLEVFGVEVEYIDQTGNPVQARKNILVHPAEIGLYRNDEGWKAGRVDERYDLSVVAVANKDGAKVSSLAVTAKVTRESWIKVGEGSNTRYERQEEQLPDIVNVTDRDGKTTLSFTPKTEGYYEFETSLVDATGRTVRNTFGAWISNRSGYWYTGTYQTQLTMTTNQESYKPGDVAKVTIHSTVPDVDVFLLNERARVDRFRTVKLNGQTATVDYKIEAVDMPNTNLRAYTFGERSLEITGEDITVSADQQRIDVSLQTDKKIYGPGETVQLTVKTADATGRALPAEVAVWTVDKALFELTTDQRENIFEAFWDTRYIYSPVGHSLEHINVYLAEGGGGCFVGGTQVLMADGTTKSIENVVVGDLIQTRKSESDPTLVTAAVTDTHQAEEAGYFIINGNLQVTPNHILWVNDTWKTAAEVQVDDRMVTAEGEQIYVNSVEWLAQKVTVYNLTVENYHTYFADGYWVHNQKGEVRSVLKDAAYWNPTVRTDSTGTAQLTFKLPDNLTTWAITAVAATSDTKVGEIKAEVITQKSVVVRPVLPNILRVGDTLQLSTLLHNFTDTDKTFNVSLNYPGVTVNNPEHSDVLVPGAGGVEQLFWQVQPTEVNPQAKATFTAKATEGDFGDAIEQPLPVIPFGYLKESSFAGLNSVSYPIQLPADTDFANSQITLSLSPTMLGTLPSAMQYLLQYPYGCVEQTTSRFVPAVIGWSNQELFTEAFGEKDVAAIIQKGINRLDMLQNTDGGWGWTGRYSTTSSLGSDPFITAYVTEYLVAAQKTGATVPEEMLTRIAFFANSESSDTQTLILKEYTLLQLNPESNRIRQVPVSSDMTPDVMSYAVLVNLAAGQKDPALNGVAALKEKIEVSGGLASAPAGSAGWFGSRDASTAMALRALVAAGEDPSETVPLARYLMEKRTKQYWSNTFATAQVIQAIVDFTRAGGDASPTFNYTVLLDGQSIGVGAVTGSTTTLEPITISPEQAQGKTISIQKDGEGSLYSTLQVAAFRTDPNTPAEQNGIKITREYVAGKGPAYYPSVGDTVTVNLKLENIPKETEYLVIEDQLPAGLVPINTALNNQQQTMSDYYYGGYWYGQDTQVKKDGAVFLLTGMNAPVRTLTYQARVIAPGEFRVPPATVADMYNSELSGQTAATTMRVTIEPERDPAKAVQAFVTGFWGNVQQFFLNIWIWIKRHSRELIGSAVLLVGLIYIVKLHKKSKQQLAVTEDASQPKTVQDESTEPNNQVD